MSFSKYLVSKSFWKNLGRAILIALGLLFFVLISLRVFTLHGRSFPIPDMRGLSLEEVHKVTRKSRLRYQIVDSVYNNTFQKGTVVEQNPYPGFHVKKNRNVFLTINAFNPEMILVPNVKGMSLRQAKATLERNGLAIGKISYEADIATNNVLNQTYMKDSIVEGYEIEKGSRIDLVLGRYSSSIHTMVPDIRKQYIENARDILILSSLNLGRINYDESIFNKIDSVNAKIFSQYPLSDGETELKLGRNIDIWVTVDEKKLIFDADSTNF